MKLKEIFQGLAWIVIGGLLFLTSGMLAGI